MLVSANYEDLIDAKMAIEHLSETKPSIYHMFLNIIELTRKLNFGYQYMGALLMDEDPSEFKPVGQDDYVLSVYQEEIEKLKKDEKFSELKQLLKEYEQVSYANISKLALGNPPRELAGPTVIH
ncbi:hypothetical protein [Neobacillus cucumis]|uniref:Uncharacterized protein n=1 Tax=Neobacillus cucumis TaxID=1740721 RepID=A0A2N5H9M7_9BACI|nr:hypothetical protein [Neobacillus cucumis]PLS02222.1 hypothetical protein CVD27_20995 [Neobacillus cucumis]